MVGLDQWFYVFLGAIVIIELFRRRRRVKPVKVSVKISKAPHRCPVRTKSGLPHIFRIQVVTPDGFPLYSQAVETGGNLVTPNNVTGGYVVAYLRVLSDGMPYKDLYLTDDRSPVNCAAGDSFRFTWPL